MKVRAGAIRAAVASRLCPLCEGLLAPERFAPGATVCRPCAGTPEARRHGGPRSLTGRRRPLHPHVEGNARLLRTQGFSPYQIADALGIRLTSEWNELVAICAEPQYRRFQKAPNTGGPVHRKSGRYWAA